MRGKSSPRKKEQAVRRSGGQVNRTDYPTTRLTDLPAFRSRLLRWYARHARDLPWRRTRDPYHIVVSEFMLQQTQVSRVELFYSEFLERFPTIEHLARARPKAVREAWEGL